ncbi:MAG TPA: divergent PAP2 family protein [bacterium]|nr:divergent PAP2 family protein [bacterium]
MLLVMMVAWFLAQTWKMLNYYHKNHKINFRLLVGTGGMPSSHSAFVCSLAASLGFEQGWDSSLFYLGLGVALIVMTDAAGVRRAAGQQAQILNEMMDDLYKSRPIPPTKLKELLGHTPTQVVVGAFLGIAVAVLFYTL